MTGAIIPRTVTIYKITSVTGKSYVGATVNILGRLSGHFATAKRGKHRSKFFQSEYDSVGRDGFTTSILAFVPVELKTVYENIFIKLHGAELNGVKFAVPFRDAKHIDKVNAARLTGPNCENWIATANDAAARAVSRKVICIETGQEFASLVAARAFAGGDRLGEALKHPHKTAYGYHWRYGDDNYRPRKQGAQRNRTVVRCIDNGLTFYSHDEIEKWITGSGGKRFSKQAISQACTRGHRAYGFRWERVGS